MEMNDMTVYEILEKKKDLEQNVKEIIRDFNDNVYKIHSVNVEWYDAYGGKTCVVDVEVLI